MRYESPMTTPLLRPALALLLVSACGTSDGRPDGSTSSDGSVHGQSQPDLASSGGNDDLTAIPPSGSCVAGEYVGTYAGTILVGGLVSAKTKGTVDLTLGQQQGEFSPISNGMLMGDASGNPYKAELDGSLDCTNLKLSMGMLKNGTVVYLGVTHDFSGPLTADYDPKTVSFVNGTWMITETGTGKSTGSGTWTATLK